MAQDKFCVVVDKAKVLKIWEKSMTKAASEALAAGAEAAVAKSSKVKIAKAVPKDEKGFNISLTVNELSYDEKKNVLAAKVAGVVAELPEDKYNAGLSGNGSIPKPNMKKIEGEVRALLESLGDGMGQKAKKFIESR